MKGRGTGGGVLTTSASYGGPPAPLHPAGSRADWGRSTPGQEEPWGVGVGMGEGKGFLRDKGVSSR